MHIHMRLPLCISIRRTVVRTASHPIGSLFTVLPTRVISKPRGRQLSGESADSTGIFLPANADQAFPIVFFIFYFIIFIIIIIFYYWSCVTDYICDTVKWTQWLFYLVIFFRENDRILRQYRDEFSWSDIKTLIKSDWPEVRWDGKNLIKTCR